MGNCKQLHVEGGGEPDAEGLPCEAWLGRRGDEEVPALPAEPQVYREISLASDSGLHVLSRWRPCKGSQVGRAPSQGQEQLRSL